MVLVAFTASVDLSAVAVPQSALASRIQCIIFNAFALWTRAYYKPVFHFAPAGKQPKVRRPITGVVLLDSTWHQLYIVFSWYIGRFQPTVVVVMSS